MKIIVKISIGIIALFFLSFLPAGTCTMYAPVKEGTELEMRSYTDNDKFTGMSRSKVIAVRNGGQEIELKSEAFDKKEKLLGTSNYKLTCEDGVFNIDMKTMISQEQMTSFKDMQVNVEADKLDIPADVKAGQDLKNGTIRLTGTSEGSPISFKLSMIITNRKVAAIEDVTVPAGTFKCVKITYDAESKMLFTLRTKGVEWYSKEVGLVRSEAYSAKDKLQSYTVLQTKK